MSSFLPLVGGVAKNSLTRRDVNSSFFLLADVWLRTGVRGGRDSLTEYASMDVQSWMLGLTYSTRTYVRVKCTTKIVYFTCCLPMLGACLDKNVSPLTCNVMYS
jgi:hypothetical protein